jgi:NAD(P)-dependent dehydrogenase (short-subunit alcohol dehydrogenase family)
VKRVLIIGGYGGFGARLSRRLLAAGHRVLVAGRNGDKGAAFCAGLDHAEPVIADRARGIGMVLARYRPDLVIDAAGPFQSGGHVVPEACIAMRIPYLDLADARDFVMGIGALDLAARAAGVPAIAGASSMSALSGAVTRGLADGMEEVRSVEMAISASNRASAGVSVAAAILSYIGRPVRLWRGGRWTIGHGWQEMRREPFLLVDGGGLASRLIAIADVPDHEIVPEALPGRPTTAFRAGTELDFQMIALWLASWPVRWRLLNSFARASGWLLPLYRMTLGFGGDKSAMHVILTGLVDGKPVERRWTLVAANGDGPEIPVLAVELLAGDMLAGRVAPGARHGWGELPLARFEPLFAALSIRHETRERVLPPPLYARVMGDRYDALPPAVRDMHWVVVDRGAAGEGAVTRGAGFIARLIATVMRFPPAGHWPLHVAFAERDGVETWTRDFGGHRFASELSADGGRVVERFGPIRFAFDLLADVSGLTMGLRRWSIFGIPLPLMLAPRIAAREWQEDDRFRFEIDVAMPLIGCVIRYTGWLRPVA